MSDLPKHIAIIMDGNGRWAQRQNLPRISGHKEGANRVHDIVEYCGNIGISALTLFAFSCENWGRPEQEVEFLLNLFFKTLEKETKKLIEKNVCLRIIGDVSKFSDKLQKRIHRSEQATSHCTGLNLNIAANYSGRWDIANACQQVAKQVAAGQLSALDIDSTMIAKFISLNDLAEPDLFIRTSGEQRISNYLLWQLAYTELYFTDTYWPDFSCEELQAAITFFQQRQRRFGLVPA